MFSTLSAKNSFPGCKFTLHLQKYGSYQSFGDDLLFTEFIAIKQSGIQN